MSRTSKGIGQDRLVGIFGSKYLAEASETEYIGVDAFALVVQEDTVFYNILGGDETTSEGSIDYMASQLLSGVTVKQGALITAPQGELFKTIGITSGSVIAYR
jgi:hypothetical protein